MQLAHLGIAVFVIGVTLVGGFQDEKDVRMEPGDTVTVGGHEFKFLGVHAGARAPTTRRRAASSR